MPDYDINCDGEINNLDSDLIAETFKTSGSGIRSFYYHFDGLSSVIALSDESGNTVEIYQYDVYGAVKICNAAWYPLTRSQFGNRFLFTGREFDSETGLYNYRARVYNPAIGRFLQTDPIGYGDGMNWYAYCGNSPAMFVDPWGLCGQQRGFWGGIRDGALVGDFDQKPSWGGIGTQVGMGFIPYVGQAADVRDTVANLHNVWNNPKDGWAWGGLGAAGVAWVPGAGDAVRGGFKSVRKAGPAIVAKYGPDVAAALKKIPHVEGVYDFVAASGKKYIGQSKDLYNRILTHLRKGKLDPGDVGSINTIEMPGSSSIERKIVEQQNMLKAGGPKGPTDNKMNAIKEADWSQYGIEP